MSKSKNKAEKLHLSRVAELRCIVCRNEGLGDSPAEIHHCSSGNHTLIPRDKRKQITADEYAYVRHHNPKITAEEAYRLAKDGPRYKAIGNSMAVPVMRWIGKRIKEALDA